MNGHIKTVLVIDDEVDLVDIISQQLTRQGYDIVTAYNGIDGYLKFLEVKPDLVILDMNIPGLGGVEFYTKIVTAHGHLRCPVLVLTGRSEMEDMFRDLGVDGFLSKPFSVEKLIQEVGRILRGDTTPLVFVLDLIHSPNSQAIRDMLVSERYRVIGVEDFQGVRQEASREIPSYILMEYIQKGVSGDILIRRMRDELPFKNVPILVYTYSGLNYGKISLEAGADRFLGKPATLQSFVTILKELEIVRTNPSR